MAATGSSETFFLNNQQKSKINYFIKNAGGCIILSHDKKLWGALFLSKMRIL